MLIQVEAAATFHLGEGIETCLNTLCQKETIRKQTRQTVTVHRRLTSSSLTNR